MKARYTPVQTAVASVEERHRDALEGSPGLEQHAGRLRAAALDDRTDRRRRQTCGRRSRRLRHDGRRRAARGLLATGVRAPRCRVDRRMDHAGQAFGGELEAVTVWTGMLAAKEVLGADVIVVADGPGNLGTDTTWGVSALGSGNALNAAAALGGRPIPSLRISFADGASGIGASRIIRSRSCATSASFPRTCRCRRSRTTTSARGSGTRCARRSSRSAISSWRSTVGPRSTSSRARRHRAPLDGPRRRRRPGVLPGRGGGRRPRGQVAAGNRRWRAGGDA